MAKFIDKFKRASAGALAAALIALSTSCTYVPPEESTLNSTSSSITETTEPIATQPIVTDKVTIEDIEDIKPVYNQNVVEPEMIEANNQLNATIKKMINENKYYGNNFDHLVERLTITNIAIEAYNAEEDVSTDYAPSNLAKVTITYDADVINKQTAEKSTITNTISYVVNNAEVASLANQQEVDYVTLATAVNTATEEKLEEIEATGEQATEQDDVTTRQSVITDRLMNMVLTEDLLNDYYNQDFIQQYLNDGYEIITTVEGKRSSTQTTADLRENGYDYFIYHTPTITTAFYKQPYGIEASLNFNFVSLAYNKETGDKNLITTSCNRKTTIPQEMYDQMKALALEHAYFDPYELLQQDIDSKGDSGVEGWWYGTICGGEPFTEEFYSTVQNLVNNYNFELYIPYDRDLVIKDANNVYNYEDAKRVMTLMDENNTNVYIKAANNEAER